MGKIGSVPVNFIDIIQLPNTTELFIDNVNFITFSP